MEPLEIISEKQTSIACPTQFEGFLSDGTAFYFRLRHGTIGIGVGKTVAGAVNGEILYHTYDYPDADGFCDYYQYRVEMHKFLAEYENQ